MFMVGMGRRTVTLTVAVIGKRGIAVRISSTTSVRSRVPQAWKERDECLVLVFAGADIRDREGGKGQSGHENGGEVGFEMHSAGWIVCYREGLLFQSG